MLKLSIDTPMYREEIFELVCESICPQEVQVPDDSDDANVSIWLSMPH